MVVIVVALDDCTRSVATPPQKAPRNGVSAALLSAVRSPEPASPFSPAVITVMPSRNRPTPPMIEMVVDIYPLTNEQTGVHCSEASTWNQERKGIPSPASRHRNNPAYNGSLTEILQIGFALGGVPRNKKRPLVSYMG